MATPSINVIVSFQSIKIEPVTVTDDNMPMAHSFSSLSDVKPVKTSDGWAIIISFRDSGKSNIKLLLSTIANQATWLNTRAGAIQAYNDLVANFNPATGGSVAIIKRFKQRVKSEGGIMEGEKDLSIWLSRNRSIYEKASVVIRPNAYAAGKIYALKPENGTGDLTVTRNSQASRTNSLGLIELMGANVPLIDYSSGEGVIKLQPQQTNIIFPSNPSNTWNKSQSGTTVTINENSVIAPNGLLEGTKVTFSIYGGNAQIFRDFNSTAGVYTCSIWAKVNSGTKNIMFGFYNNTNFIVSQFTLTETWQKIHVTGTLLTSGARGCWLYGVGGGTNVEIDLWGGSVYTGSLVTTDIATTTSAVTRVQDLYLKTGLASSLNASEGTVFFEGNVFEDNGTSSKTIQLSDGTDNNVISISFSSVINRLTFQTNGGGGIYRYNIEGVNKIVFNKIILSWKNGNIFCFLNGIKYNLTLVSGSGNGIPSSLSQINLSTWWYGLVFLGNVKNLMTWKTQLTDAECSQLTTP